MGRRADHTREELHALIIQAARDIVEQEGAEALTIRRIGGMIGYSSGTLYNLFADLDDVVVHLNATTLDALYDELRSVPTTAGVEATLIALADRYIGFVQSHTRLWALLFQSPSDNRKRPNWYYGRMDRLFTVLEHALVAEKQSLGGGHERDLALILWSSLHGMCSLAGAGAVLSWDDVARLSRTLILSQLAVAYEGDASG